MCLDCIWKLFSSLIRLMIRLILFFCFMKKRRAIRPPRRICGKRIVLVMKNVRWQMHYTHEKCKEQFQKLLKCFDAVSCKAVVFVELITLHCF